MNINSISFGQNFRIQIDIPVTNAENFHEQYVKKDSFEKQHKGKTKTAKRCLTTGALIALLLSQMASCTAKQIDKYTFNSVEIPYSDSVSLNETAEIYNVSPEFIAAFNNLNEEGNTPETIKIPERIDLTDNKIAKVREKLYDDNLSDSEKAECLLNLAELEDKKSTRDEVAEVYADGRYTYFFLKANVNVEDFKELFDIKDGRIKANNKLEDYGWGPYHPEMGTYKDYTKCVLHNGDIIKVPNFNSFED